MRESVLLCFQIVPAMVRDEIPGARRSAESPGHEAVTLDTIRESKR